MLVSTGPSRQNWWITSRKTHDLVITGDGRELGLLGNLLDGKSPHAFKDFF